MIIFGIYYRPVTAVVGKTLGEIGAEPYWRRRVTIKEVYDKYKHFDKFFCDDAFLDSMQAQARYDMWQAIRAAGQKESAPTSPNSVSAPLICECGDHITGDYAFVDGKYLCPVCMEW